MRILNYKKERNLKRDLLIKLIKGCMVVLVMTLVLEIWFANRLSTYGSKLTEINQKIQSLDLENQVLKNEIAQKSSYLSVQSKASQLGFVPVQKLEYINSFDLASTIK